MTRKPLFSPFLAASLCLSLPMLAGTPGTACADVLFEDQGLGGMAVGADDFIAPGYPLHGDDRVYQGYGTRADAPVFAIAHGKSDASGPDASGSDASDRKERDRLAAEDKKELDRILNLKAASTRKRAEEREKSLKAQTLREAAGTIAFQKAVSLGYARYVSACKKRALELDRIFNFRSLLMEGRVLPPVIRSLSHATTLSSPNEARFVEQAFRIAKPARMVSTSPTWRDYLETEFAAFEAGPDLLPGDEEEARAWQEGAREGWSEGLKQARDLFDTKFAELVSDFRGMLEFRMLAQRGMVSMPQIARGDLGIRAGDRVLHLNESVFRITLPASFLPAGGGSQGMGEAAKPRGSGMNGMHRP